MNRRQFLKTGLLGGIALAAGGAWVVWRDVRDADGGNPPRDGSYEYYVSEPVVSNDYKGVGAFILAANELGR